MREGQLCKSMNRWRRRVHSNNWGPNEVVTRGGISRTW